MPTVPIPTPRPATAPRPSDADLLMAAATMDEMGLLRAAGHEALKFLGTQPAAAELMKQTQMFKAQTISEDFRLFKPQGKTLPSLTPMSLKFPLIGGKE